MRRSLVISLLCACALITTLAAPIQAQPHANAPQQATSHTIFLPFVAQPLPKPNFKIESSLGGPLNTFELVGSFVYLGEGVSLSVFDTSADGDPKLFGQTFIHDLGEIRDIAIFGQLAFVASDFGFAAFSIADPTAPSLLSRVSIHSAKSIQIIGTKAYVGTSKHGIAVVDISNPQALQLQPDQTIPINTANLQSTRTLLFAFGLDNSTRLIDANTGAVLSTITPPSTEIPSKLYSYSDAIVRDDIAYLLHDQRYASAQTAVGTDPSIQIPKGFDVVDIRNPSAPVLLKSFGTDIPFNDSLSGFFLKDSTLYLNVGSNLNRYDISDASNPIPLNALTVNQKIGKFTIALNRIYTLQFDQLFRREGALRIIELDTPGEAGLPVIGEYTAKLTPSDSGLQVLGNRLHTLHNIYDITTPTQLKLLSTIPNEPDTPDFYVISNTLRYAAANDFNNGDRYHFLIYDQSDASKPKLIASKIISGTTAHDIDVAGRYGFVASDLGLQVVDLSSQANPTVVKTIHSGKKVLQLEVEGSRAYLLDDQNKLSIYNISDPLNATELGSVTLPFAEAALLVQDGYAYAYAKNGQGSGIVAIDISQAATPTIARHFAIKDGAAGRVVDLVVNGSRIFALTQTGLSVYERSAQGFAQLVGELPLVNESYTLSHTNAIAYHNNYLYLYSYYLGAIVIRIDSVR
jgi:hypothetical protein